jgi:hypothetical protein
VRETHIEPLQMGIQSILCNDLCEILAGSMLRVDQAVQEWGQKGSALCHVDLTAGDA